MRKKMKRTSNRITQILIISGLLLLANLMAGYFSVDWVNSIGDIVVASGIKGHSSNRITLADYSSESIVANQGGVNIQKTKENAENVKNTAEGKSDSPDSTAKTESPELTKAQKKKAKLAAIDPETLKRALEYFQSELTDRNVIIIAMDDDETPYISKSFRDNPFDEVAGHKGLPDILKGLSKIPSPPLYPPPGELPEISTEQFQKYVDTLELKGVVFMEGQYYAFIKAGSKEFTKAEGEDFRDRFLVNVDEVTFDGVLISDEYGDQGLLDFGYKKGYQVQPIDDVLYISNYGPD